MVSIAGDAKLYRTPRLYIRLIPSHPVTSITSTTNSIGPFIIPSNVKPVIIAPTIRTHIRNHDVQKRILIFKLFSR